jgi:hypothetical protein
MKYSTRSVTNVKKIGLLEIRRNAHYFTLFIKCYHIITLHPRWFVLLKTKNFNQSGAKGLKIDESGLFLFENAEVYVQKMGLEGEKGGNLFRPR